jgi:DNA repair exonuclease SbcCD ATPase subunit
MSNGHEAELLTEVKLLKNDLDKLSNNVEKLSTLYLEHIKTDGALNNKLTIFEQNLARVEKVSDENNKLLRDGINNKDGLITQIQNARRDLDDLLEKIKEEKINNENKIKQEKDQQNQLITKQQQDTIIMIEQQNAAFNRKMGFIGLITTIVSLIATFIALFK